jgi:hypothetical protein
MLKRGFVAFALIALATPMRAEEPRRQLEAHAHGEGRLAIAIEGKRLEMELEVPAHDILGFEHAARTASQKKVLADARKRLARLAGVIVLTPAAGCKLSSVKVSVLGAAGGNDGDHDHGHNAEKKSNAAKVDDRSHKQEEHGAHSEFRVTYAVDCAAPGKLGPVSFDYFKAFKGAGKLNVTVVGPKGQSSYVVTRDKPVLDLSGVS